MLEVPQTNGTAGTRSERYRVQVNLSWKLTGAEDEIANGKEARLAQMNAKAKGFSPSLQRLIGMIPEGTEVTEIRLTDWPCERWNNHGGRVTLVGDGKSTPS
jgi:hypothetical protein